MRNSQVYKLESEMCGDCHFSYNNWQPRLFNGHLAWLKVCGRRLFGEGFLSTEISTVVTYRRL